MTIVRSLAPWIAYAVLSSFVPDRVAALAAVAAGLISLTVAAASGRRPSELVVELSTLVFFAGYTALDLLVPHGPQAGWVSGVSQLWLAGTVGLTLVVHKPFTLAIAKTQAPQQVWETPEFYAFNVRITAAWLVSFTISGVIMLSLSAAGLHQVWIAAPVMVLAIVAPIRYTDALVRRIPKGALA